MKYILIMLFAFIASEVLVVYGQPFFNWVKAKLNTRRVKPLDCPPCLSFWLTAIILLLTGAFWLWAFLSAGAVFQLSCMYQRYKMFKNV